MLRSSLCNHSDTQMLVSRTTTVAALPAGGVNNNIEIVLYSIY